MSAASAENVSPRAGASAKSSRKWRVRIVEACASSAIHSRVDLRGGVSLMRGFSVDIAGLVGDAEQQLVPRFDERGSALLLQRLAERAHVDACVFDARDDR